MKQTKIIFPDLKKSVKPRYDNKGSEFGEIHRKLPIECGMFDFDRMSASATIELELKKQNVGFIEYRTNFNNSTIEWKALFEIKYKDSKQVQEVILCPIGTATWAQLKLCIQLEMRYFIVIANNGKQPFNFYEIDYFGNNKIIGILEYGDRNIDGEKAINNFWKNKLKLL